MKNLYVLWSRQSPIKFILTTVLLSILALIPIVFIFEYFGIDENDIGGIDFNSYSDIGLFFMVVVVAPLVETLIFQVIPIELIQKILKKRANILAVFVSALFFSYAHIGYSFWYFILIIPLGFLLAESYMIFQKKEQSSYWIVTAIHALRNLIAFVFILGEKHNVF